MRFHSLTLFVETLCRLKQTSMSDSQLRAVWRALPRLGDSIKGKIMSRYVQREEPTLYGLFNAGTNVL